MSEVEQRTERFHRLRNNMLDLPLNDIWLAHTLTHTHLCLCVHFLCICACASASAILVCLKSSFKGDFVVSKVYTETEFVCLCVSVSVCVSVCVCVYIHLSESVCMLIWNINRVYIHKQDEATVRRWQWSWYLFMKPFLLLKNDTDEQEMSKHPTLKGQEEEKKEKKIIIISRKLGSKNKHDSLSPKMSPRCNKPLLFHSA